MPYDKTHPLTHLQKSLLSQIERFDALDWVAAFFVIATPLYIAYRLIWN